MKKLILMAVMLCGAAVWAEDEIVFQTLYWQIGNGYAADQADAGFLYAQIGDGEKIYIDGYSTAQGSAVGVGSEALFKGDGSALTDIAYTSDAAMYYFELVNSETDTVLSTSEGFTYGQLLAAGAFKIDYAGSTTPSVNPSGTFTAYTMIPEPTSGLLLLFGLAGLALKRKRA